jgi:hypothetical protein
MSYRIAAGNANDVETEVQNLLSAGFELHGSIQYVYVPNSELYQYSQPMYHPQPNLIKQRRLTDIASGNERLVTLVVVHNSRLLEQVLTNSVLLNNQNRNGWIHCKLLDDHMSTDFFVKDEKFLFNKGNIEQGLNMSNQELNKLAIEQRMNTVLDALDMLGGRRSKTSRRK